MSAPNPPGEEKRPVLRVVSATESLPVQTKEPVAVPDATEEMSLKQEIASACAQLPVVAAYLVCAGYYLARGAVDIHRQAAAHAPTGTFRHDIPPGLKSAEATLAWIKTHTDAVKDALKPGASTLADAVDEAVAADTAREGVYSRHKDLVEAVELAVSEVNRAAATAKTAGLGIEGRRSALFDDAKKDLQDVSAFLAAPRSSVKTKNDIYVYGLDVLGAVQF